MGIRIARSSSVPGRTRPVFVVLGVAIGLVLAGVVVPLAVGHDDGTRVDAAASAGSRGGGQAASTPAGSTDGPGAAGTADAGQAAGGATASAVSGTSSGSASSASAAGGSSTASNAPVTPAAAAASTDPIKVGILLLNIGNISAVGFGGGPGLSPAEQQTVWDAYINDTNKAGGINGRPIKPTYQTYDPLSDDDMRSACLALTEDAKSFVVVDAGGFIGPPVLCVSEEHKTPFILTASSGVPQEYYGRSNGRLFTIFMGADRAMHNLVNELARLGVTKTNKIGILADYHDDTKETPDILQKYLEQAGYNVAYRNDLSGDLHTGSSQMPVEVSQMRSHGVDTIVNIANAVYIAEFVQGADAQQYHPKYVSGDWQGGSTNFYFQNMPASFDGNPVITTTRVDESKVNLPEAPVDAACIKRAAAALNTTVDRDSDAYGTYVRICAVHSVLVRGLQGAASQLTADNFSAQMQQLGPVKLAGFGGGALSPGRFDATNAIRTVVWKASCKCLMPIDDFRPTAF
jgi:ABC-type branched-subunit amino acid transport system substrate-binding protein